MNIENEIKVLNIDVDEAIKKLEHLKFVKVDEYFYKRYIYNTAPPKENAWLRLRTDGYVTTLTYKESTKDSIDGMKEIEVTVDDFNTMNTLLETSGIVSSSYQENKRLLYEGVGCQVSIDYWPLIPPYLEIESSSVFKVEDCLKALGYSIGDNTTSLSTKEVYGQYHIDLDSIDKLIF